MYYFNQKHTTNIFVPFVVLTKVPGSNNMSCMVWFYKFNYYIKIMYVNHVYNTAHNFSLSSSITNNNTARIVSYAVSKMHAVACGASA